MLISAVDEQHPADIPTLVGGLNDPPFGVVLGCLRPRALSHLSSWRTVVVCVNLMHLVFLPGRRTFIVSHGTIRGKGLQLPGTNFVDKTLKPPESTYKTTFLVLSRIWYKICTRAWSPFPLIIPWKTLNFREASRKQISDSLSLISPSHRGCVCQLDTPRGRVCQLNTPRLATLVDKSRHHT